MASDGVWMANKKIFLKNDFIEIDKSDRFELLAKKFDSATPDPQFIQWATKTDQYKGWHLLYADQCPWHVKSVEDILNTALDMDIDLNIRQLTDPKEAQDMPCGYGTFALIHNGKILADHYISKTRFRNIVQKMK